MVRERETPKQQQQVSYTVEQLVAVNPYNPDILPDLENYVNEQVSSQTYSLDANLCLLRLYQFEPERMSTQIVARILVKACLSSSLYLCRIMYQLVSRLGYVVLNASFSFFPPAFLQALMAMPAPDFSLCLFLIPERVQMEEQFKTLIVLSHYLETGRFRQFWDEAAKNRHIVEAVPGFEQAIQTYAIHVLSLTYQKIPRPVLAEAINIEGLSLDKFLEHQAANSGWILEKGHGRGQLIVLPRNEFNHPELKKSAADSVPLEHITRIFPILG
ncbi:Eukaryotic translation initiation factor 3 subunit K [Gossypium arboreum]|uniref:Eukaryotic translation initiation factor 3 subunit K n=1 Tax=Gossypium arboreum TaxID=29729 RepID=A0A0B0MR87_GOSAR|nr:Eukaryotic translation initiation factor 3 subunit K [Gossypium arboreum]